MDTSFTGFEHTVVASRGNDLVEPGKVAIPRTAAEPPPYRQRVARACQACRERKTKCGGEKPSCEQCSSLKIHCIYSSNKREQDKVVSEQLAIQNEQYKGMLRKVVNRVGSLGDEIQQTLQSPSQDRRNSSPSLLSAGSLDGLDIVDEDLNRSKISRAAGFIGKSSEITWMQRLEAEANKLEAQKQPPVSQVWQGSSQSESGTWHSSVFGSPYYENQQELVESDQLNPYDLPPKHAADVYYDVFMKYVDIYFPVIQKSLFSIQYENYYTESSHNPGDKWLSVLNMVFAIASRYCLSSGEDVPGGSGDHIFFSRAKLLSANGDLIYDHPDLQQVQTEVLLSLYFLLSSQVNSRLTGSRAWRIIRLASSSAIALGINMRNVDDRMDPVSKEVRCRLWCSIVVLENTLTTITGRPSNLYESFFTHAPLPFTENRFEDFSVFQLLIDHAERAKVVDWTLFENEIQTSARSEQLKSIEPSSSLYFFYQVDLSLIANFITSRLYGPSILRAGRKEIEDVIESCSHVLDRWLFTLNDKLQFSDGSGMLLCANSTREQISLALYYYSTCILLNRPCLSCRSLGDQINMQFTRSHFGNKRAQACVHSALSLLAVLPDKIDESWLRTFSPWWTVLHFVMQATTVLLIHIIVGKVSLKNEEDGVSGEGPASSANSTDDDVLPSCKKALHWMHHMGKSDLTSRRGFLLCHHLLCRIASLRGFDLKGLPTLSSWQSSTPNHPFNYSDLQPPSGSAESFLYPTHTEGIDGGLATVSDMWSTQDEMFPLSFIQESDIAWFLSMADSD